MGDNDEHELKLQMVHISDHEAVIIDDHIGNLVSAEKDPVEKKRLKELHQRWRDGMGINLRRT